MRGWRTGSPDRLNQVIAAQQWDPSNMFGGRRMAPSSVPAPSPAEPLLQREGLTASSDSTGFIVPEWCVAPPHACEIGILVWKNGVFVDTIPFVGKATLLAGRLPECDIILEHPSVSRKHAAVLHHRSGAVYLLDLNSAHGTFLSGTRLAPHEPTLWPDGASCVFGGSSRTFVLQLNRPSDKPPRPSLPQALPRGAPAAEAPFSNAAPSRSSTLPPSAPLPHPAEAEDWSAAEASELAAREALCDANTRRNIFIPLDNSSAKRRRTYGAARSVKFDSAPPCIRIFEVASPEPIIDPETKRDGRQAGEVRTAELQRTVGPARPTLEVSVTRVLRGVPSASSLGVGQFDSLASVEMAESQHNDRLFSASDSARSGACPLSSGSDAQRYPQPRSFPKERWRPAQNSRTRAAAQLRIVPHVMMESQCEQISVDKILSHEQCVDLHVGGVAQVRLLWEDAELNPIANGCFEVHFEPSGPHEPRAASIHAALRKPPDDATYASVRPLLMSVINMQPRPIFVYAALLQVVAGQKMELPLSPWDNVQAEDETPVPLSMRGGAARGSNCLLLSGYEGLPQCTAEDAERAPFGESNTFRHVALTGQPITITSVAQLLVEIAFQNASSSGDGTSEGSAETVPTILGGAYDDATPGEPFCVLTVPIIRHELT